MLAYDELERLLVFADMVVGVLPGAAHGPVFTDLSKMNDLNMKQKVFRDCVAMLKRNGTTRADIKELLKLADKFC